MKAQTSTVERAGAEQQRLAEARERGVLWRKWGPLPQRAAVGLNRSVTEQNKAIEPLERLEL